MSRDEPSALACPPGALCLGGTQLPRPRKGFWVDRRALNSSGLVSRCSRLEACVGTEGENSGLDAMQIDACWTAEGYSDPACGHASGGGLQCDEGSEGVLCGSCVSGFTFSPVKQTCQVDAWV
jgi:hypothetical protein